MNSDDPQRLIDEAIFAHTMGDSNHAEQLLLGLLNNHPDNANAWHSLAEIRFAAGNYAAAREAGLRAVELREADVHLHTTLSRIFMELGDKETAEQHGARARVLGWKAELSGTDED